ncbi:MAG TPA: hypothetical protein VIC06_15165 [Solirubrobacteraceae bacterium]
MGALLIERDGADLAAFDTLAGVDVSDWCEPDGAALGVFAIKTGLDLYRVPA